MLFADARPGPPDKIMKQLDFPDRPHAGPGQNLPLRAANRQDLPRCTAARCPRRSGVLANSKWLVPSS
jgi:hypothetical protein